MDIVYMILIIIAALIGLFYFIFYVAYNNKSVPKKDLKKYELANEEWEVIKLDTKEEIEPLAYFFHKKWGVPVDEYIKSMQESLNSDSGVPAWYYVTYEEEVIGGLGVIENDFHKRKDLSPNICAVYVKEEYRHNGICRKMFKTVLSDLKKHGIQDVYLITTHTNLYENFGFYYYGDIEEENGNIIRCYHKSI